MPRHPRLRDAQNFLRNPHLVRRLLALSSIAPADLVVEIGPGTGLITVELAARCRQVLAIELDPRFGPLLRRRLRGSPNVALFIADATTFPLPHSPYKVFANIPFNQTAAIIARLTSGPNPPADTYLVVQREAAARFTGTPRETLQSVLLKPWFAPSIVHTFQRTDFSPSPAVDSVLLRLEERGPPLVAPANRQGYRDLVCALFGAWEPTVAAGLRQLGFRQHLTADGHRTMSGVDVARPPTALSFPEWLALTATLLTPDAAPLPRSVMGAEARLRQEQAGLVKEHRTRQRRSNAR